MMIGVYHHLLSKVFRFHYLSQKVIGSLGYFVCVKTDPFDREGLTTTSSFGGICYFEGSYSTQSVKKETSEAGLLGPSLAG